MSTTSFYQRERNSLLPEIRINKTIISSSSVRFRCSLIRPRDLNYNAWLGSSEFLQYVDFHFAISRRMSASEIGHFYYPSQRVRALASHADVALQSWADAMLPANSTLGIIASTKINLVEILQGRYLGQDALVAMETIEPTANIDASAPTESDVYFEVVIDLEDGWERSVPGQPRARGQIINNLDAIAFAQFDIETMSTDIPALSTYLAGLDDIGGPLLYEKLLETRDGKLLPPNEISVFFDEQGLPHTGVAHLHSAVSPAPDGYTGWMSGPVDSSIVSMADRKKLTKTTVLNNKVVSKLFLESQLGFDGNSISVANRFSGYSYDGPFGAPTQDLSPYGNLNFAEHLLQTLKAEEGALSLGSGGTGAPNTIYNQKLKALAMTREIGKNLNIFTASGTDDDSWLQIDPSGKSYYGKILILNFEQLIKTNSRFGYLIDFHRNFLETSPPGISTQMSHEIIRTFLEKSRIYQFKVSRRRATNRPIINNRLSTPTFAPYDENEIITEVIETSSREGSSSLRDKTTSKGALEEKSALSNNSAGYKKVVLLKDFDLFENVSEGRYQHSVNLTAEDGIHVTLVEMHRQFIDALNEYTKYVEEASKPSVDPSSTGYYIGHHLAKVDAGSIPGNYDYHKNEFTDSFKNRSDSFSNKVVPLVVLYANLTYLFSLRTGVLDLIETLSRQLLPAHAEIGNLQFFLDLCLKLDSRIKNKIYFTDSGLMGDLNLGSKVKNVTSDPTYPDKFITAEADIKTTIKVVSKNAVLMEPHPLPRPRISAGRRLSPRVSISSRTRIKSFFSLETTINNSDTPLASGVSYQRNDIVGHVDNDLDAKIKTAIISSGVKEHTRKDIDSDLELFDGLVSQYKGTTFQSLLAKTRSVTSKETISADSTKEVVLSSALQASLFNSILSTEDKEQFVKEVEEKYKDTYFVKKSLGDLHGAVKTFMSNAKEGERLKKAASYKDRVLDSKTPSDARNDDLVAAHTSEKKASKTEVRTFEMNSSGELIPVEASGNDGIGIFVMKEDSDSAEGAQMVNNVFDSPPDTPLANSGVGTILTGTTPDNKGGGSY